MHGQKRDEYKARLKDDAIAKKLAHKAQQWHMLSQTILLLPRQQQQQQLQDLEARGQLTEKLLCVNPDPLYLWNHRREQLILMTKTTANPSEFDFSLFWENERNLTQTALSRNPKAYGAWFHRKWALRYYLAMIGDPQKAVFERDEKKSVTLELLQMELHLCGEFLLLDERNFHCWNYRRFIVGLMMDNIAHGCNDDDNHNHKEEDAVCSSFMDGSWSVMDNGFSLQHENLARMGAQMAIEEERSTTRSSDKQQIYVPKNHKMANQIQQLLIAEWNFTTEKIEQNFSNGSAFHYRSKLLPLLIALEKDKLGNGKDEEGNDDDEDGCPSFVKVQVFQKELEIIRNAIFTEPDDQTSWWYFRFILSWANPVHDEKHDGISMEEFQTILYDEWNTIQELVQDEDWKCKWGLLGLHMIASEFCNLSEKGLSVLLQEQDWKELERTYLMRLMELDPDRRCRYQSMFK